MPTVDHRRCGGTMRPATMTSIADGRDHLIGDPAAGAGIGNYVALCGHRIVPAALTVPPGPTCLDCETALHRSTITASASPRRGVLARLSRLASRWLAVHDRKDPSGGAGMTCWYVASLADGDTHLAEPVPPEGFVAARCDDRRFRPLATFHGTPPDQAKLCPHCRADQR